DAAEAHLLAVERAAEIGFGRYIISATSPFTRDDLADLARDPACAVRRHIDFENDYARRGWRMFDAFDRVYDNARARADLGWRPAIDFAGALERLRAGRTPFSDLAGEVGAKGYHAQAFDEGPYPVE
ncbi:MAG: NAD(P)-dependent oxidoreductase, partial [Pseudomonadota bacterium]